MTYAFETDVAVSMLTSGKRDALIASFSIEAKLTQTLSWTVAITLERVATWSALGDVAEIPCPSR